MTSAKIRIKNYRCFGHEPQEIEISTGFTGFVGLNNAGKSATLKLFYEFRPLWTQFSHSSNLNIFHQVREIGTLGLQDNAEVFNHFNNKPIELVFIMQNAEGKKIEYGLRISPRNQTTTNVSVSAFHFKIDGVETQITGSSRMEGSDFQLAYQQINPNGHTSGFISLGFLANFFDDLSKSIYIPSFRNVINIGENGNHYDIATGTAFIKQWNEWKTGTQKFNKEQIIKITNDIQSLFGYKNLEINSSVEKNMLWLNINGKPYSMLEVGSGLSQFILTFATAAIKKPTYIFIDEPELNLHPALQLKFITNLGSYASKGIVFATHSLGLARSAEKVFSVYSDGQETKVKPFTNTPNYATLLGELSFSAYKEIGVDCIFFVEGITEIRTMQEFLRKFGKDNKVLLMSLGGNDMINGKREAEISEITNRMDIKKVYAWIDSEKDSSSATLKSERKQFVEVCERLGIICGVSERRAIENYFNARAISAVYSDGTKKELTPYDKPDPTSNWSKEENWKVAREMTLEEMKDTDLGRFIDAITC